MKMWQKKTLKLDEFDDLLTCDCRATLFGWLWLCCNILWSCLALLNTLNKEKSIEAFCSRLRNFLPR